MCGTVCPTSNIKSAVSSFLLLLLVSQNACSIAIRKNYSERQDSHHLTKRLKLQFCLGHFDIHKNTIIRTAESQALGGKYIQGLGLETQEECQRLCCETDKCDVYVFEDKAIAYCYLFECGPADNFHCKFTRHGNYTSAVLIPVPNLIVATTPRPSPIHYMKTEISQQEKELLSLKVGKPSEIESEDVPTVQFPNAVTPVLKLENEFNRKALNKSSECGRFQFPCHSGECIAIYNACDGIPQCEDGSDEGPECSRSAITATNMQSKSESGREPNEIDKQQASFQIHPSILKFHVSPQHPPEVKVPRQRVPIATTLENNRADSTFWKNRKVMPAGLHIDENTEDPALLTQNLIWPPAAQEGSTYISPIVQDFNVQHQQSKTSSVVKSSQSMQPLYLDKSPQQEQETKDHHVPFISSNDKDIEVKKLRKLTKIENEYEYQDLSGEPTQSSRKVHKHKTLNKISLEAKELNELENPVEVSLEQQSHPQPISPINDQFKIIKQNLALDFRDHDGQSERPSGAVVSLAMGLLVTAALAILIGCRMRTVTRRSRRSGGKTSYGHEADFLVNGMYL